MPQLVAFVDYVTSNKVTHMETSVPVRCVGSHKVTHGQSPVLSPGACVQLPAGPVSATPLWVTQAYGEPVAAGGVQGCGERSALLLGPEEVVLLLRTSQKGSLAVGLVS